MVKKYFKRKLRFNKKIKKLKHISAYFGGKPISRKIESTAPIYCRTDGTGEGVVSFASLADTEGWHPLYSTHNEFAKMYNVYALCRLVGVTVTYMGNRNPNYTTAQFIYMSDLKIHIDLPVYSGSYGTVLTDVFFTDGGLVVNPGDTTPVSKRFDYSKVPVTRGTDNWSLNTWNPTDKWYDNTIDFRLVIGERSTMKANVNNSSLAFGELVVTAHFQFAKPISRTG